MLEFIFFSLLVLFITIITVRVMVLPIFLRYQKNSPMRTTELTLAVLTRIRDLVAKETLFITRSPSSNFLFIKKSTTQDVTSTENSSVIAVISVEGNSVKVTKFTQQPSAQWSPTSPNLMRMKIRSVQEQEVGVKKIWDFLELRTNDLKN